jgi:hypothetical protein
MGRTESDSIEDFKDLYDFQTEFEDKFEFDGDFDFSFSWNIYGKKE